MSQSLHPMLNIAIKAARAAGAIINRGSQDLDILKISSKGPNDFVSEIDQMAEAAIIEILLTAYPGHGILAEESGREHGAQNSEFTWIIDPLDGTTNFLHGFPAYAVSIALAWRGVVQQAVVYDPTRNDLFYASRGRGAFLNDKRLRVSKRTRLADALIGTGFPFRRGDNFQRYLKMLEVMMPACAGLRRPGAAALDLCYVAAGWYDGFFETGLQPWDMAAGTLIITEAGGLVGNFTGEADFLYQRELVAGSPKIYGQMVGLLAPFTRVIKTDEADEPKPVGSAPVEALAAAMAAGIGAAQAPGSNSPAVGKTARAGSPKSAASAGMADAVEPVEPVEAAEPAEPAEPAERKTVRIRKSDLPPADPSAGSRMGAPRFDGGDRPRGPRPEGDRSHGSGRPAPGRPLPVKR